MIVFLQHPLLKWNFDQCSAATEDGLRTTLTETQLIAVAASHVRRDRWDLIENRC
jgi:hypothetical protein